MARKIYLRQFLCQLARDPAKYGRFSDGNLVQLTGAPRSWPRYCRNTAAQAIKVGTVMNGFLTNLPTYLPLLIVYLIGLRLAIGRRQQQPQSAPLAIWSFLILLGELIVGNLVTTWLIAGLNAQAAQGSGMDGSVQVGLINTVGIVRTLVHTLGMALLIRALFPRLPGYVAPRWTRWVLGVVLGLLLGGAAGVIFGDPISLALGIADFEGGRGYFVAFVLIPAFALLGALAGAVVVGLTGQRN